MPGRCGLILKHFLFFLFPFWIQNFVINVLLVTVLVHGLHPFLYDFKRHPRNNNLEIHYNARVYMLSLSINW